MAQFRVVHGQVKFGGETLPYGGQLDLTEEQAEHLNAHGELVVTEADFQRLEQKKKLDRDSEAEKEAKRLAGKRGRKAPEPEPEADEGEADGEEPPAVEEPAKKGKAKKGKG